MDTDVQHLQNWMEKEKRTEPACLQHSDLFPWVVKIQLESILPEKQHYLEEWGTQLREKRKRKKKSQADYLKKFRWNSEQSCLFHPISILIVQCEGFTKIDLKVAVWILITVLWLTCRWWQVCDKFFLDYNRSGIILCSYFMWDDSNPSKPGFQSGFSFCTPQNLGMFDWRGLT